MNESFTSRSGAAQWPRAVLLLVVAGGAGLLMLRECSPPVSESMAPPDPVRVSVPVHAETRDPEAASCQACHPAVVAQWETSQHALANRWIDEVDLEPGTADYDGVASRVDADAMVSQTAPGGFSFEGKAVAAIGVEPLVQALVVTTNGQWQVFNPAFHVDNRNWFSAFPDARTSEDWGHWSNRGMTWNVQCAWCHMTDFEKNHDPVKDRYDSQWKEMGISCSQCHGDLSAHAENPEAVPGRTFAQGVAQDNCMTCHARREFLTAEGFEAGEPFHGHFRLALFEQPGIYYPDGQVRDENFETGSFLSSKMHDAGVTCFDCHNPHSGGLTLPVQNNLLCMNCHAPPGRDGAPGILPTQHSHHAAGSAGNRCVECHMPQTEYMQSDLRRDHGFTVPDPQLTRTLGIPNACSRCHTDQTTEWAEEHAEAWYGEALAARRTRARAHAIQKAWDGEENAGRMLAPLAAEETNAVWKGTLLRLMTPYMDERQAREVAQTSLRNPDPVIRSSAIRALSGYPSFRNLLLPLREDPHRQVRLEAAWATLESGTLPASLKAEMDEWLQFNADQPAGALHLSEAALRTGKPEEAAHWAERMLKYDNSAGTNLMAGQIYHAAGLNEKASNAFERVVALEPENVEGWYLLGMFRGEQGSLESAMDAFRRVVLLDPSHGRAWYNLGLAHIQGGNRQAGLIALKTAAEKSPDSADPLYAMATVHAQDGDIDSAVRVLERALGREPRHRPSLQLLRHVQR